MLTRCGISARSLGEGELGKQELELGQGLIEQLSHEEFRPDEFQDEYRLRVLSVLEKKAEAGKEITHTPHLARESGKVIDLMEALKKSLEKPTADRPAGAVRKSAVNVQRDLSGET
jgi:DNA end-binding protein Ku